MSLKRKTDVSEITKPKMLKSGNGDSRKQHQQKLGKSTSYEVSSRNRSLNKKNNFHKQTAKRKGLQEGKPNWAELKKKSKNLKLTRKVKHNNLFDVIKQAKSIWEELRASKCPKEKSKELTKNLVKLLDGKIPNVVRSHDMSRIVQWLMKLGSVEIKSAVFEELIENIVPMAQSKYAHHTVQAILKYGTPEIRQQVVEKFYGNIVKLLTSRFSAPLINETYNKYASKYNKMHMRQELYGDLYKGTKNNNISCLADVFAESPDIKDAILSSTKGILYKLLEKSFAVTCNLVHNVLYDYLCHCNDSSKQEFMELIQSHIKSLLFTKYGCKVARMFMWAANNKVKKAIIKDLKSVYKDLSMNEHGCMFLLAMIDSVDDTVILNKCFLSSVSSNAEELANNEYGRKVLFYLVAHRNPTYFHPADLEIFCLGDKSEHIKKNCSQRMKELLGYLIGPLLNNICLNPSGWLSNGKVGMVTLAILKAAASTDVQLEEVYNVISDYITNEKFLINNKSNDKCLMIEDPGLHMVLKKLIQNDISCKDTQIKSFSECLVLKLTDIVLESWILHNRGCFVLVVLIETKLPLVVSTLKSWLQKKKIKLLLEAQSTKGAEILLKYIAE